MSLVLARVLYHSLLVHEPILLPQALEEFGRPLTSYDLHPSRQQAAEFKTRCNPLGPHEAKLKLKATHSQESAPPRTELKLPACRQEPPSSIKILVIDWAQDLLQCSRVSPSVSDNASSPALSLMLVYSPGLELVDGREWSSPASMVAGWFGMLYWIEFVVECIGYGQGTKRRYPPSFGAPYNTIYLRIIQFLLRCRAPRGSPIIQSNFIGSRAVARPGDDPARDPGGYIVGSAIRYLRGCDNTNRNAMKY
ncbi:hypothetical protein DFH09DRAFT_1068477 [Mycena vulgaris]|nr:hypothetical protein DFH09DRAFT_1068477 [Mycena vulgaris]